MVINVDGARIQSTNTIKYLGIQIDAKMNYSEHGRSVAEKQQTFISSC